MRRGFITIMLIATLAAQAASEKREYPRAEIKVGYTYHETFVRGADGIIKRDIPCWLIRNNLNFTVLQLSSRIH